MKKSTKSNIWAVLIVLVLLIWGIAGTYHEAAELHDYFRLDGIAVEVKAKVTKMVDFLDVNDSSAYKLYITYTYDGVTYSNVFYKEASKSSLYGKTVTVEIDPENPGNLRSDSLLPLVTYTVTAALVLVLALWAAFHFARYMGTYITSQSWKEFYSSPVLSQEAVRRDVNASAVLTRKFSVWILCFFVPLVLAGSVLFYMNYEALTVLPFYGIALATAVLLFRSQGKPANYLDIRQVILQSIEVKHDSESDTDEFIWHFDGVEWKPDDSIFVTLTSRSLSSCQPGDKFYIVRPVRFVSGKDKILRLYDAREFRML